MRQDLVRDLKDQLLRAFDAFMQQSSAQHLNSVGGRWVKYDRQIMANMLDTLYTG